MPEWQQAGFATEREYAKAGVMSRLLGWGFVAIAFIGIANALAAG